MRAYTCDRTFTPTYSEKHTKKCNTLHNDALMKLLFCKLQSVFLAPDRDAALFIGTMTGGLMVRIHVMTENAPYIGVF